MCLCISVLHYLCRMCDGKTSKIVAFIAHKIHICYYKAGGLFCELSRQRNKFNNIKYTYERFF